MEKRKEKLSAKKLCRFCLSDDESIRCLYDRSRASNSVPLSLKIMSCVSVEVFPSDKMPQYICNRCKFFMDISYEFKQICRQGDERILQFIHSGTALEPMAWPPALVKMFRYGFKDSREGGIKTIVEGGATVEVTSQDNTTDSECEDEEQNVYNVKIEEGSDEGSSACIKVVTSKESHDINKDKSKRAPKDSEEKSNKVAPKRRLSGIADLCWACDECECTYSLQQLLELHKMQKHRTRTVACDQCDAKFFSKYDLTTHQLRHSDEMPFECVACERRFKRLVLLKRHEMRMHSDMPQQKCSKCPASFLSLEELEAHQKRHMHRGDRPFSCSICNKKFHEKKALQKHEDVVHAERPDLSCEYCPERFASVSKLARHVRSHAGERAYPCKYCDKSFLKSHHYTRHVKLKHSDTARPTGEPFGLSEQYRCEQCEDSFSTQDELIYHSAIHATQNLTCPLCQEKFENVDAVTTHIKSHVNGTEFMCDLCELVFTSKEKLDNHILIAHDDELRQVQGFGQDESSMEMDAEAEEDDDTMNVREEDDQMVVEIKKADDFMFSNTQGEAEIEDKIDNTNSEDSEVETTYTELSTVDTLNIIKKESPVKATLEAVVTPTPPPQLAKPPLIVVAPKATATRADKSFDNQTASILRKAEEIKRKVAQSTPTDTSVTDKKAVIKVESSNSVGASDKSLRLLEKELQELKRTTRNDVPKTTAKPAESLRNNRRPQLHTSTPKLRAAEEKKSQVITKSPAVEKKLPERRAVKENKEPKEGKSNNTSVKEDKETKVTNTSTREEKEKEIKERDTPKNVVKNGSSDKSGTQEIVRRSTRPSKIKDYAKMIRDRTQASDDDDSDDSDDEEYIESEKSQEIRPKPRRASVVKPQPKPVIAAAAAVKPPATRKRGRPRKEPPPEVPAKLKKDENEDEEESKADKIESYGSSKAKDKSAANDADDSSIVDESSSMDTSKPAESAQPSVLVSPTGQTLKKVPIKSLPPGIKPLPLPVNARSMGPGELCEMQIGKKVVKVQKIVMTKAEVEAMAKKGLVEMKDGTMVLKQGIKIPKSDPVAIKSTLVGEDVGKESPMKEKPTPSRCDIGDDA